MATFVKFNEERFLNMDLVTQVSWDMHHKQFLVWVVAHAEPLILNNEERLVMNHYLDVSASTDAYELSMEQEADGHEGHDSCRYADNAADEDCPYCRGIEFYGNSSPTQEHNGPVPHENH